MLNQSLPLVGISKPKYHHHPIVYTSLLALLRLAPDETKEVLVERVKLI